jgi:hypothetical protein
MNPVPSTARKLVIVNRRGQQESKTSTISRCKCRPDHSLGVRELNHGHNARAFARRYAADTNELCSQRATLPWFGFAVKSDKAA